MGYGNGIPDWNANNASIAATMDAMEANRTANEWRDLAEKLEARVDTLVFQRTAWQETLSEIIRMYGLDDLTTDKINTIYLRVKQDLKP